MLISDLLKLKYPNADFRHDIVIMDNGNGQFISQWNLQDPQPSQQDLDAMQTQYAQAYQFNQNKVTNQAIYDQLSVIDIKSIRALRENDSVRVASLESQAVALRAQLLPVS